MVEEFNSYVNQYDLENKKIKLKYDHSIRVMNLMEKYAKILNFSKEEIEISKIVGLLHDIGRFEQIEKFDNYSDITCMDHADYGEFILFKENIIKLFCNNKKWYPIIAVAIKNHNKYQLSTDYDEMTLKISRLIRDVDKLDIIYLMGVLGQFTNYPSDDEVSKEVKKDFDEQRMVNNLNIVSKNDKIICNMAYVFDINYDVCLKEYKEYLDAYHSRIKGNKFIDKAYEKVICYINERIDLNERN